MDTVLLEKLPDDSRIAVLTVNRPEVLNALNDSVMEGLAAALDALEGDASVKAVILTGAGERAFVAGADISEFAARSPAEHYAVCMAAHGLFSRLETLDKVTIAAVGGWALGGGCEDLHVAGGPGQKRLLLQLHDHRHNVAVLIQNALVGDPTAVILGKRPFIRLEHNFPVRRGQVFLCGPLRGDPVLRRLRRRGETQAGGEQREDQQTCQ